MPTNKSNFPRPYAHQKTQRKDVPNEITGDGRFKTVTVARKLEILSLHLDGKSVEEIAIDLGFTEGYVEMLLTRTLDQLAEYYSKPSTPQTFVRYASFQMRIISQLQHVYNKFLGSEDPKGKSAIVGALKAQSDVYDKIIEKGLSFGIIQRTDKKSIEEQLHATSIERREVLKVQIKELTYLMDKVDFDVVQPKKDKIPREVVMRDRDTPMLAIPDWKMPKTKHWDREQTQILRELQLEYAAIQQKAGKSNPIRLAEVQQDEDIQDQADSEDFGLED